MAFYTLRDHIGITPGYSQQVRDCVYDLVAYAAENVPWNVLGFAPLGFKRQFSAGKIRPVHGPSGVVFKAGFLMRQGIGSQKWEGHAKSVDLRLDLQSIDNDWANWALQTNGKNSVTVAVCLMEIDNCFSQNQLAHGLILSCLQNQICMLTLKSNSPCLKKKRGSISSDDGSMGSVEDSGDDSE